MSESKALIIGVAGTELTADERAFFADHRPWGFILFARSLKEENQIKDLNAAMRESIGNPDAPIFIDQEGGRVQRLRPPLAPNYPPASVLGELYARDRQAGLDAARLMSRLHAVDLRKFGFTADCLPVLDVPVPGANSVIGNRAYSDRPHTVLEMGRAAAEGLMEGGILPVIKHMPGHGRGFADSHHNLPIVDASLEELKAHDFVPFRALADMPMAMTGHLVFNAIDPDHPATTSRKVIEEILRGYIGFDGLLMSDDASMNALSGDLAQRTRAIFSGGCDVVLHCNGVMDEMKAVADNTPVLGGKALARAEAALARLENIVDEDELAMRDAFANHVAAVA
ncbi:MAG: beta-N-acetylhexosaminidase [Rhizobiaceae bacterium]